MDGLCCHGPTGTNKAQLVANNTEFIWAKSNQLLKAKSLFCLSYLSQKSDFLPSTTKPDIHDPPTIKTVYFISLNGFIGGLTFIFIYFSPLSLFPLN